MLEFLLGYSIAFTICAVLSRNGPAPKDSIYWGLIAVICGVVLMWMGI